MYFSDIHIINGYNSDECFSIISTGNGTGSAISINTASDQWKISYTVLYQLTQLLYHICSISVGYIIDCK